MMMMVVVALGWWGVGRRPSLKSLVGVMLLVVVVVMVVGDYQMKGWWEMSWTL